MKTITKYVTIVYNYTKANPLKAIGIALVVGAVLGKVL